LAAAAGLATALAAAGALTPGVAPSFAPAFADDAEYVTVRDRLMCRTQQALRDGLRAIESRNRTLMSQLDGCHFSIDGVPAILIQDNISRVKIRLSADGEQADMWTVPETIKPARRER
jgi:DNA-binding transcriptional regulator YbjK